LKPCIYRAPLWKFKVSKILRSWPWPFGVMWRHRSRDPRTRRGHFPIGGQWRPCVYLAQIWRYGASKILGSWVWLFGVTWHHRSCDHWTRHMWFPIGGPLQPSSILHGYGDMEPQRYWGHDLDFWGHVTSSVTWSLVSAYVVSYGGPLEPCVYLAPLRRYKASKLHSPMLKAKSSLRMLRITWPVGQNDHIFGIPKSILPIHCTTSIKLRWRLRAVCRWKFYT